MSTQPYNKIDHNHCPEVDSPCGLKGKHRCCLCQEPVESQPKWEELRELVDTYGFNRHSEFGVTNEDDFENIANWIKQVEHQTILRCVEEIKKEVDTLYVFGQSQAVGGPYSDEKMRGPNVENASWIKKEDVLVALNTAINKLQDLTK